MINIQELRIGNQVSYQNEVQKVGAIDNNDSYVDLDITGRVSIYDDEFTAVPLTAEILEKCGFTRSERSHVNMLTIKYGDTDLPSTLQVSGGDVMLVCRSGIYACGAPCAYLHQLQNLYFALTGQELPITL